MMKQDMLPLDFADRVALELSALYERYGYKKFRLNKFERYDLYAENKAFVGERNIITFTDQNGDLLALKPDVTLSVAQSVPEGASERLYYNENVYRIAPGSHEYRELRQVGVECIGDVDIRTEAELIIMALSSLATVSAEYILDLSHIGLVLGLMEAAGLSPAEQQQVGDYIVHKNVLRLQTFVTEHGVPKALAGLMTSLATIYGPLDECLEQAAALDVNERTHHALTQLTELARILRELNLSHNVNLDFSLVGNPGYYSGLKFRGYLAGTARAVLSGGSYGELLRHLVKSGNAIGFAVYLDQIEELQRSLPPEEADVLIVYRPDDDAAAICRLAQQLIDQGKRVRVQRSEPTDIRWKERLVFGEQEEAK